MSVSRISEVVVVTVSCFTVWCLNVSVLMSILRREYLLHSESSWDFENKGYYEMYKITHLFCSEPLSNFGEKPCDDVKFILMHFLLLEYELPLSISKPV
jgi:hypothetical protein